jgi:hypothetical protein
MRINLFVLFTVCLLLLIASGPVAGYKPSDEEIARMVEPPSVTIGVRVDPAHMPPPPPFGVGVSSDDINTLPFFSPGDTIECHGTNTASDQTYIFISGPGLAANGAQINNPDPAHSPLENGNAATFQQAAVGSDHKWSWTWDTDNYVLEEGTYTLYVVPKPNDKDHLSEVAYGTTRINIKNSAGSVTASPTTTTSSGSGTPAGKGIVTIVAAGDQNYDIGEEIGFSGTNTWTYKTYLFIVGPGLPGNGANIARENPRDWPSNDQDITTFKEMDVNGDHTWSWKWGTANSALDPGTYTVYAVSQPLTRGSLEQAAYDKVSLTLGKQSPTATTSPLITKATTISTTAITPTTSAAHVATPEPTQSPGFGFPIILIGLGAVVFIIVRRG